MRLRETVIVSGGLLAQQATVFATGILTARLLGADGYGTLGILKSLAGVLVIVTPLGLDLALLKHASFYRDRPGDLSATSRALRLVVLAVNLVLLAVVSGAGGRALQHVYAEVPDFAQLCLITMLGLVFAADVQVSGALYRVVDRVVSYALIVNYTQPVARLAASVAVLLAGGGVLGIAWVNSAAFALAFVMIAWADRRHVARPTRLSLPAMARTVGTVLSESLWMAVSLLVYSSMRLFDVLILAALTTPAVAGRYTAMSSVAQLIQIYPGAVSQTLGPQIALAYRDNDRAAVLRALQGYLRKATLMGGWLFGGIAVFGTDLDLVFGPGFDFPAALAILLATGWFVSATLGPFGYVLSMTGRHRLEVAILAAGAVVLVGLLFMLIPPFGATGAATAVALVFVGVNAVRGGTVIRIIGANPLHWRDLLPPACFLVCAALCREAGGALAHRTLLLLLAECVAYLILSGAAFVAVLASAEDRRGLLRLARRGSRVA